MKIILHVKIIIRTIKKAPPPEYSHGSKQHKAISWLLSKSSIYRMNTYDREAAHRIIISARLCPSSPPFSHTPTFVLTGAPTSSYCEHGWRTRTNTDLERRGRHEAPPLSFLTCSAAPSPDMASDDYNVRTSRRQEARKEKLN